MKFHLGDILSVTHGRLVSPTHIGGVYKICNFLTDDDLYTHQLPRVYAECKAHLLALHPQLNQIPLIGEDEAKERQERDGPRWWALWLDARVAEYGEYLEVTPIPKGIHEYKDPIIEAEEMVGPDNVIVIKESE